MNRFWKITKTAAGYTAGAVAGGALFAVLGLAILTPEKTPRGQFTDPLKYWTDNQYFTENFLTAANAAEPGEYCNYAGCGSDWECEQIYGADYNEEEETF